MPDNKDIQKLDQTSVVRPYKGLHDDNSPIDQPEGTYRYALNAINQTPQGDRNTLSFEQATVAVSNTLAGSIVVGVCYIGNNMNLVAYHNSLNNLDTLVIFNIDNSITKVIENTTALNLQANKQLDMTYRVRKNNHRYVYWVDGYNDAKEIDLDELSLYYSVEYKQYLSAGGDPDIYPNDKWNSEAFFNIKTYSRVPFFTEVNILENGSITPGSYNAAVQYLDSDLNPTNFITVSNTINIYNDSIHSSYDTIHGSRNVSNDAQSFPAASKSIQFFLSNLDPNYAYYRLAIIVATSNDGNPSKSYLTPPIPITTTTYIYNGDNTQLVESQLSDIAIDKVKIEAPTHIEQLENRLILAGGIDTRYKWCDFQPYASKVSANLVTQEVVLNSQLSIYNSKNPESTYVLKGYMPGEAYSFGIMYLMEDNSLSPVFHIPGKSPLDTNPSNLMEVYECSDAYVDTYQCVTNDFWGVDYLNNSLSGNKIRQHRFPFRRDVQIPLIVDAGIQYNIESFTLGITFDLAAGKTFPVDANGKPLVLSATILYKLYVDPTIYSKDIQITRSDMGNIINVYSGQRNTEGVPGYGTFTAVDPSSVILQYQTPVLGSNTFVITPGVQVDNTISVVDDSITSELFGISFSGVQKPNGTVGFYIMRINREDNDRLIVDYALVGPTVKNTGSTITAFAHFYPEIFPNYISPPASIYNPQSGSVDITYTQPQTLDDNTAYVYSLEHQFFNKKFNYSKLEIQGTYNYPSAANPNLALYPFATADPTASPAIIRDAENVFVNKIQTGTKYDPTLSPNDLNLYITYKNIFLQYNLSPINPTYDFPGIDRLLYINATANFQDNGVNYYNASCDNKIAMALFTGTTPLQNIFKDPSPVKSNGTNTYLGEVGQHDNRPNIFEYNQLAYAAVLSNSTNIYSNFQIRDYYKEHPNPVLFGINTNFDEVRVFNGDSYVSKLDPTLTLYNDFIVKNPPPDNGNSIFQIIAGIVLLAAAVVITVASLGTGTIAGIALSATAITMLTTLAITYGIAELSSGISHLSFTNMSRDYPNGLKDCITDVPIVQSTHNPTISPPDPSLNFVWNTETLGSLFMESSINANLRCPLTCSSTDFYTNIDRKFNYGAYKSYITAKLTVIDPQGSGTLYRGIPCSEYYDMNLDYLRRTEQQLYFHLPESYNCCQSLDNSFPTRIWYSQQSFQEETTDNYGVFLPNNYKDIQGEHGKITDLFKYDSKLYVHTEETLWYLAQTYQERVTTDIVSFLGTGDYFAIPARMLIDSNLGSAGSLAKWSTLKTRDGVIYVSQKEGRVYLFNNQLNEISQLGKKTWFRNNLPSNLNSQFNILTGTSNNSGLDYYYNNNPNHPKGIGVTSGYDPKYNRVLITKKDYLLNNAFLPNFTVQNSEFNESTGKYELSCGGCIDLSICYDNTQQSFAQLVFARSGLFPIYSVNAIGFDYMVSTAPVFSNKSWTISFSLDTREWVSYHSYLPYMYFENQLDSYYIMYYTLTTVLTGSITQLNNSLTKYLLNDSTQVPHIIELVYLGNPILTKLWDGVDLQTIATKYDVTEQQVYQVKNFIFNQLIAYNSRQCTGLQQVIIKDTEGTEQSFLAQQVENRVGQILIERRERDWKINDIRDYRVDYTKSLFTNNYLVTKPFYPIDKVLTPGVTDFTKDWTQVEGLRDKFIVVRYIYNPDPTNQDVNLITTYTSDSNVESLR